MGCKHIQILFGLLLFLSLPAWSQSLVEDAKAPLNLGDEEGVFTETIKVIGQSKKIFVLSNNNQLLGQGDFISVALNNQLAARAVVAKTHEGQAGIKIIKIYSLAQWTLLRKGIEVQIIRGDDSMFGKKVAQKTEPTEEAPKIKTEEDLFSLKDVDDSGDLEDDSKRHIKPDNLVSFGVGFLDAPLPDVNGGGARANQFTGTWGYQFADNWFGEFSYSAAAFEGYPAANAVVGVTTVTGRLKYNFKGPLYTFFMPYIGFRSQTIDTDAGTTGNPVTDQQELQIVSELQKVGPVFGVTFLRRLVPGWFLKADLGTDILNVGAAIEF
jgi:hypothetical protein